MEIDEIEIMGDFKDHEPGVADYTEGGSLTISPKRLEFLTKLKELMFEYRIMKVDVALVPKRLGEE